MDFQILILSFSSILLEILCGFEKCICKEIEEKKAKIMAFLKGSEISIGKRSHMLYVLVTGPGSAVIAALVAEPTCISLSL
jgi:hypothetical protein